MKELSTRTAGFTDSVIRRMTRVCSRYDAVNLSQGFPDFTPPRAILDRLKEVADEDFNQYSITWGAQNTREALAAKESHYMGIPVNPDTDVVITCGGTEAMMAAMMTICNPGDKVAVFSPFYENYGADAILSGAEPVYIPLVPPAFTFDPEVLEDAFRNGAKALILCNPSNPSGKVFTMEEMMTIADIVKRYDGYVVTDEVYEHIVYAPNRMVYMASLPGMLERTISTGSLSKTYSITGWRLGYTIAPAEITDRIRKVHDFLTVGAAAPLQEAVVTGLKFGQEYYDELLATYTHKRDLFCDGLAAAGLVHNKPQGAYYVMVDISEWMTGGKAYTVGGAGAAAGGTNAAGGAGAAGEMKPVEGAGFSGSADAAGGAGAAGEMKTAGGTGAGGMNAAGGYAGKKYDSDLQFCYDLAEKVGVGAVPGSSFFHENVNHLIRFHFAKKDETLYAALDRLQDIQKKMGQ